MIIITIIGTSHAQSDGAAACSTGIETTYNSITTIMLQGFSQAFLLGNCWNKVLLFMFFSLDFGPAAGPLLGGQ